MINFADKPWTTVCCYPATHLLQMRMVMTPV